MAKFLNIFIFAALVIACSMLSEFIIRKFGFSISYLGRSFINFASVILVYYIYYRKYYSKNL